MPDDIAVLWLIVASIEMAEPPLADEMEYCEAE